MKFIYFALLLFTTNFCGYTIVTGDLISIKESPFYAQLFNKGGGHCGASIISEYWLITDVNCFKKSELWQARTGASSLDTGGITFNISKVILPDNDTTSENSLCLIKLRKPIEFNEYQYPVRLDTKTAETGDFVKIIGFGNKKKYRGSSSILKAEYVPVASQEICGQKHANFITGSAFCAGEGKPVQCPDDSGGPGILADKLVAVISSGCASPGSSVFTRVDKHREWIAENTGIKL